MKESSRTAIVTGGNRGLGFETCRRLAQENMGVVLTSRSGKEGRAATDLLRGEKLDVVYHPLDVTRSPQIDQLYQSVVSHYGRLDILVNNAGVFLDEGRPVVMENLRESGAFEAALAVLRQSIEINTVGTFCMCQKFIPLMKDHDYGRVVNVSSGMAQLALMGPGWPA